MEGNSNSVKNTARLAGLIYLFWIITGLFAMFYVPSQTDIKADAAATVQNIFSDGLLFRTSIVNDIFRGTLWVIMGLVFYRLFKQVDVFQARFLVALVIVQIPTVFFVGASDVTSPMILKGELLKTFDLVQRLDPAMFLFNINDNGVAILEAFWGLWLFPLAILVYRSRFLPRFLGVWLFITGSFYLVLSFTDIMLPQYRDMVLKSPIALPVELGEVAFALWLLIKGANVEPTHDLVSSAKSR